MDNIEREDHIIAHQAGVIRDRYDEEQATNCNYGWGIDERDDYSVVTTKIYGRGAILTTTWSGEGPYLDEWDIREERPS